MSRAGFSAPTILILTLGSLFLLTATAYAEKPVEWYTVSEVLSGDSFKVGSDKVIRYASVAAPDPLSPSKRIEDLAKESLSYNRNLLEGRKVRFEWGSRFRDDDGAYLAYVYAENGDFLNETALASGFTKVFIEPPNLEHADALRRAADNARKDMRGLWRHEEGRRKDRPTIIANMNRREFHYPDCERLEGIPVSHLQTYHSKVDALSDGHRICSLCKGEAYKQRTTLY